MIRDVRQYNDTRKETEMDCFGEMKGCLYYSNLREYIEDELVCLEIWKTGNDGEIGAFFESLSSFPGLGGRGNPGKTERVEMCGYYLADREHLWLEAFTQEMTIRIDAFWDQETGLLSGFCRRRRKASICEAELCLQMKKEDQA